MRVVAVFGACVPDPQRRLPGRGAHLHPDQQCLERAERRKAFPRALRVPGPLDLAAVREAISAVASATPVAGAVSARPVRAQADPE